MKTHLSKVIITFPCNIPPPLLPHLQRSDGAEEMLSGTTPPFSKSVKSNVARNFLQLLEKHFPDSNPLHKLFNRNTVKVSYSCMPNVKSAISRHNNQMLSKTKMTPETENCNCQKPSECPLNKKCLSSNIVYKAVVTSAGEGETKEYIGMTATTFKTRYRNHKKSFNYTRYEKDTALSKLKTHMGIKKKQQELYHHMVHSQARLLISTWQNTLQSLY